MKGYLMPVFCSVFFLAGWIPIEADAQGANAQSHAAAARALAYEPGHDFTFAFEVICAEPRPAGQRAGGGRGAAPERGAAPAGGRGNPPRAQWYAEPVKLFDNLYYVGTDNDSVYALTTSEGIVLLNAGPDYSVEAEVVDGMKKLGLDPANIKYTVVADARAPSYGGVRFLQDHYETRVLSSEADWNVMAKTNVPDAARPRKDMVVTDGQKLTLGDTTVTLYVTPGHTPGTISMIIPLRDGNQRHVAALLGGRDPLANGEGVQYFPTELEAAKAWKVSINRFRDIAAKAGADVFLITRGQNDRLPDKIRALKYRKPGGPHPFVNKDAIKRYLTMTSECMDAQLAWRASGI
jgi:metallo-beta-lactamase class B